LEANDENKSFGWRNEITTHTQKKMIIKNFRDVSWNWARQVIRRGLVDGTRKPVCAIPLAIARLLDNFTTPPPLGSKIPNIELHSI
jgi:hypothetical protein